MSREFIARLTKMPRSIGRLSASVPSHHSLSLADFITNTAESDFQYTQVQMWRRVSDEFAASRRHVYRGEYEQQAHNQTDQRPCHVGSPWPAMGGGFFASRLHVTPFFQMHRPKPSSPPLSEDVARKFLRGCDAAHTRPNSRSGRCSIRGEGKLRPVLHLHPHHEPIFAALGLED
jgi:hypothetical protein